MASDMQPRPVSFAQSILSFLDAAASAAPTPGGGSVASLAAALGCALLAMAAELTTGERYPDLAPRMRQLADRMRARFASFQELAEADATAFCRYMDALRMPKATPAEREARRQAMSEAALCAARVPLTLAELCRDALAEAVAAAPAVNTSVVSDLGAAAWLLEAAAQGALLTAAINLPAVRDDAEKALLWRRHQALRGEIAKLRAEAVAVVEHRLGGSAPGGSP